VVDAQIMVARGSRAWSRMRPFASWRRCRGPPTAPNATTTRASRATKSAGPRRRHRPASPVANSGWSPDNRSNEQASTRASVREGAGAATPHVSARRRRRCPWSWLPACLARLAL